MPEIAVESVVSDSSADPRHRVENLLHPDGGGHWRSGGGGEKRISAVLQLQRPQRIHSVHIGNDGAAFVELLVALGGGDFQVLLPTAAFLSPSESRSGAALQRVRIFGPTALLGGAQGGQWDRVRVVCTQPYCTTRPFGLSFIRLFSPPSDGEGEKTKRWGPFTLRQDVGPEAPLRPGELFYRRPTAGGGGVGAQRFHPPSAGPPAGCSHRYGGEVPTPMGPRLHPPRVCVPPDPKGSGCPRYGGGRGDPRLDLGLPTAAETPPM